MTDNEPETVTVIGAGTMGHGIATVVGIAGYRVTLQDVDEDALAEGYESIEWSLGKLEEKGLVDSADAVLEGIHTETEVESAVKNADVVIEAVPESMDLKQTIFADVDDAAPDDALLATNTSSLSVSEIAEATDRPGSVLGLHFFNPPVKMDLVEVIHGDRTTAKAVERGTSFVESLDKEPIEVRKDVFGFVVNDILHAFIDEPAWMVSRGKTTIREADAALSELRGYPMGPFELSDLAGIDVSHDVRKAGDIAVPPVMAKRVEAGEYGRKSGVGYYDYETGDGVDYQTTDGTGFDALHVEACMINKAAELLEQDVTTVGDIDTGMQLGTGFPVGVCERADTVGLDIILHKLSSLYDEYDESRYEPSSYLVDLVENGKTGVESGAGFYEYDE
jgi:enoyl-CoA hydratase/3-hydroxyacyl-CoA dehydrogenase